MNTKHDSNAHVNTTNLSTDQWISCIAAINRIFLSSSETNHDDAVQLWRVLRDEGRDAFWEAYLALFGRDEVEEGENILQQLGPDPTFGDLHVLIARSQQQV